MPMAQGARQKLQDLLGSSEGTYLADMIDDAGGVGQTLDLNGLADGFVLDADGDTTLSSPTDDQLDVEVGGVDVVVMTASAITLADAVDIAVSETTGTKIGTATGQKLGFFNAAPVAQRSAYTQTFSTADKTHANPTAAAHTYPASGNLFDAVAADLLINIRDDSTANAVADAVVNIKSLADNLNQLIADVADAKALINSVIDDLQALGLVG